LTVIRHDDVQHRRFDLSVRTAGRHSLPLEGRGSSGPAPGSSRASVPVTPTASQSAPVDPVPPAQTSPPSHDPALQSSADLARAARSHEPVSPDRVGGATTTSTPQLDELQFTLPRAVTERIDQLERRLKKLETFSTPAPSRGIGPGAGRTP
jgi:hypothetical protein